MAATKRRGISSVHLGLILTVLVAGIGFVLFDKKQLTTQLKAGDIVKADFARDYRLRPYISKVKVAGVQVGVVTAAKQVDSKTVEISMKINKGMTTILGSKPSANVRSITLLGGSYYVDLVPGGDRGVASRDVIPMSRTTIPVELDQVVGTFLPDTRTAAQHDTVKVDQTLTAGGTAALQSIAANAPTALPATTDLFNALQGTQPKTDLPSLVGGLESTSRQLTASGVQLDQALQGLNATTGTLAANSTEIARTIAEGPSAMDTTQQGMASLRQTLTALEEASKVADPTLVRLNTLLDHAAPALAAARPLVHDLRPLMGDLRATVDQLVPTVGSAQTLLDDVRSPVITRVSGLILTTVLSPYRGSTNFYKELAYMFAGMNATSMTTNANGPMIDFQAGGGVGSASQIASLLGPGTPPAARQPATALTSATKAVAK